MALEEEGRDNILHERVSMLQKEGYRGFTLNNIKKKWDGVSVTVKTAGAGPLRKAVKLQRKPAKKL